MHPLVDVIIPGELASGDTFAAALARHPDRDVLIALSRESVDDARILRLAECARREVSVATLGTFSGAGPIAYRGSANPAELDSLFARENAGICFEIPCAVPPWTYVTRRALAECGAIASAAPPALLDFCKRATESGFRHLLCADVHVSAPASDAGPWQSAIEKDKELAAAWDEFRQRAPATPLRRRVDLARLRESPRPRILFVTHQWGGGIELHVRDLARLLAGDCEVLTLRPGIAGTVQLEWLREGEDLHAWFETPGEWRACLDLLRALGVARAHIHHVHGLPREALGLPRDLGIPYDITLHDHFAICPQYHLADANGRYCGEPDVNGCTACIAMRPAQWGLDIAAWRELFHGVLADAARVIAPSADMAARIERYFPDVKLHVLAHPEMRAAAPQVHKVLVLGGLSAIKGMDLFEACVRDAFARGLSLHFQVLGHISRPLDVPAGAPVAVSGSYDDTRLATLVALERPDAFLFLSQVPESYSYTLSVAMQSGKPIVATQMGAFVERLRGYAGSSLVPGDAGPGAVNDALLRLVRGPANAVASRPVVISAQRA